MIKSQHTLPFTLVFETSDKTLETFKGKKHTFEEILDQLCDGSGWADYLDTLMTDYVALGEELPLEKLKKAVRESEELGMEIFCQNISIDWSVSKGTEGEKIIHGEVTWETEYPVSLILDEDAGEGLVEKFELWFLELEDDDLVPIWSWGEASSKVIK
jgi:hypothetical protein